MFKNLLNVLWYFMFLETIEISFRKKYFPLQSHKTSDEILLDKCENKRCERITEYKK